MSEGSGANGLTKVVMAALGGNQKMAAQVGARGCGWGPDW